jgi:Holliday junction resolvase-like predicted endonuclease
MRNFKKGEYNFKKDLITGEVGEDEVKSFFEGLGFVFIGKCNNNEFDLIMEYNRRPVTIEVKTDSYRDTGNIAIEIESRGKPSGLSVTKADYFATIFRCTEELWIIKTSELLELISNNNFYLKENGGDKGSNTKFYLISKSKFRKNFQIHKLS